MEGMMKEWRDKIGGKGKMDSFWDWIFWWDKQVNQKFIVSIVIMERRHVEGWK